MTPAPNSPTVEAGDGVKPRLSPEEIADFHARFISCNSWFAEPEGLVRPPPHIDTPILLSHGPDKALDMLLERLREPWEKMNRVAAKKISRILADRREAVAAIVLLRGELATARARCIALNKALTPSAETKAAYIGEVKFTVSTGFDEDGCEIWQDITVPWTTTKDIMAMILGHAAMLDHPAYAPHVAAARAAISKALDPTGSAGGAKA